MSSPSATRDRAPRRPPSGPDPERLASLVARTFLEVEAGLRPLAQLAPLLAPALRSRLETEGRRGGRNPAADAVVSIRSTFPTPDACDAAVVVRRGLRTGALVIRLERHAHTWRITELARPEDPRPHPGHAIKPLVGTAREVDPIRA